MVDAAAAPIGQAPQGATIPTPPNFPIAWEEPGDEHAFWTLDRMHFPRPITPLADSFLRRFFHVGYNRTVEHFNLPIRMAARRFNTYHYEAIRPLPLAPEEAQQAGAEAQRRVTEAMGRQMATWRGEQLPAILGHLAALRAFDLAGADAAAFLAHLDDCVARWDALSELHFTVVFPPMPAMSLFQEAYRDLLGGDDEFDAFRLLQGFENETTRANRALWRLAQSAKAAPEVLRAIETVPGDRLRAALADSAAGRAFLPELEAFLHEFGRRGTDFFDLDRPAWIEDPTPAIVALRAFLASDAPDPEEERRQLAASRDRLLATVRERLQGYPEQAIGQFEFLLRAAQEGVVLSEDHGFYIDWQGTHEFRRLLLEAGRRLAAGGAIDARDDVFLLTLEEVRAALAAPADHRSQGTVAQRRAAMDHFAQIAPPPAVGTPPAGPPPDDAFGRAIMKFFGGPPPPQTAPDTLRGHAGSPGRAIGRARIIRTLAEAGRLEPGDILVAETTAPPWTPLFATVAAVVTDTGGVLSHSAVVAREYNLPAVVGVGAATLAIRNGQLIEVDGTNGIVRLLAD